MEKQMTLLWLILWIFIGGFALNIAWAMLFIIALLIDLALYN
jgi:hypothetical protein